jgi:hypothetical protein
MLTNVGAASEGVDIAAAAQNANTNDEMPDRCDENGNMATSLHVISKPRSSASVSG